jgi:hypothetical protein
MIPFDTVTESAASQIGRKIRDTLHRSEFQRQNIIAVTKWD